jgi:hypothetical protein
MFQEGRTNLRSSALSSLGEKIQPFRHSGPGLGRSFEDRHARPHCKDIGRRCRPVEFTSRSQVDLRHYGHIGGVEQAGILERFVFALRHG